MSRKMQTYRCSSCNETKTRSNVRWRCWDHDKKKPENCSVVGICQKCDNAMKKTGFDRVETFVMLAPCQCFRSDCLECVERQAKANGLSKSQTRALVHAAAARSLKGHL